MRISGFLVAAAAGFVLAGCATVTRGTTEKVEFQSEPAGAHAKTNIGFECTTPCSFEVSRKQDFVVTFSLPGYESTSVDVKSDVAPGGAVGIAGNVLIGGAVGIVADAASGATLDHKPNPVVVTLRKLGPVGKVQPAPKGRKAKAAPAPKAAPAANEATEPAAE
jgi:hypothetical protein